MQIVYNGTPEDFLKLMPFVDDVRKLVEVEVPALKKSIADLTSQIQAIQAANTVPASLAAEVATEVASFQPVTPQAPEVPPTPVEPPVTPEVTPPAGS